MASRNILFYTSPALGGILQLNHALLCAFAKAGYRLSYAQEITADLIELWGRERLQQQRQKADSFVAEQRKLGIEPHFWLEAGTWEDAEKVLAAAQPDLIIFSNGAPVANLLPKQLAVQNKIPFIIIENLVHPGKPPQAWQQILPTLAAHYEQAQAAIAVSQDNLNLLRQYWGLLPNKGQVIYNGRPSVYFEPVNLLTRERLRQELAIPLDAVVCFTAARLDIIKGYQYQIAAIKQLKQLPEWEKLYFVWAGAGTLAAQFQQQVRQIKAADKVKFLGEINHVIEWLDASDIFILPSEAEGMPLAIMEAMAKGLPAIATAVSGIPEQLGETGKLLPPPRFDAQATIAALASTIRQWTADAQLRQAIGQACRERAIAMFAEARMIQEYLAVIS